ncbi:MAG: hypothetical protein JO283_10155 [Bradyrhizobium sp.]|nr:hypothetical protein [Bradyrhizobium sp.]
MRKTRLGQSTSIANTTTHFLRYSATIANYHERQVRWSFTFNFVLSSLQV